MRITQPEYRCDKCGKARSSDVNHWLVLVGEHGADSGLKHVHIHQWPFGADREAAAHACGESCMVTLLTRFFATGSFENPKPLPPIVTENLETGEIHEYPLPTKGTL